MQRARIAGDHHRCAPRDGGELVEIGRGRQRRPRGRHLHDRARGLVLTRSPQHEHLRIALVTEPLGQRTEARHRPALVPATGARVQHDEPVSRLEADADEEVVDPRLRGRARRQPEARAARRHGDAERLEEREILIDHVTGLRRRRHAPGREHRAEALATPSGGEADAQRRTGCARHGARLHQPLQVDGDVEAPGAQPPAQRGELAQHAERLAGRARRAPGARVHVDHLVERRMIAQERGLTPLDQPRQARTRKRGAQRVGHGQRVDHIAQRRELDERDGPRLSGHARIAPRSSEWRRASRGPSDRRR